MNALKKKILTKGWLHLMDILRDDDSSIHEVYAALNIIKRCIDLLDELGDPTEGDE